MCVLQEWLRESRVELDRNAPLCRELRDFQAKVQACGPPYQQWCAELRAEFPALVSEAREGREENARPHRDSNPGRGRARPPLRGWYCSSA